MSHQIGKIMMGSVQLLIPQMLEEDVNGSIWVNFQSMQNR